jgi:hypothetical protein
VLYVTAPRSKDHGGATRKLKAPLRFSTRSFPAKVNCTETKFSEIRK